jgi:hypothetical protein
MEDEIKVGDTIFWWGDYYDGTNEDGSLKFKYQSGVNKVVEINLNFVGDEFFRLDNRKMMFYSWEIGEHRLWELIKPEDDNVNQT